MSKELKMEVFASKEPVKNVKMHVYEFHTSELYEDKYRLIRSAAWKDFSILSAGIETCSDERKGRVVEKNSKCSTMDSIRSRTKR